MRCFAGVQARGDRYGMLDGWRGVAASVVVLHHVSRFRHGHEAVLVFFVISGYCITASMEACERDGIGFGGFLWRRIRRIHPPYLLAIAFFVATRLVREAMTGRWKHFGAAAWAQNLTLTQWLTLLHHPKPFAADNPSLFVAAFWSLCYEEQFYLVMALLLALKSAVARRAALVGLTLVSVPWILLGPRLCYGTVLDFWPMLGLGCLLFFRLKRMPSRAMRRATDAFLVAVALASALAHRAAGRIGGDERPVMLELSVATAFALLLLVMHPIDAALRASPPGRMLAAFGLVSYSLYLVHQFNVTVIRTSARWWLPEDAPAFASSALQLLMHVAVAAVFWFACERPFLNRPRTESPLSPAA